MTDLPPSSSPRTLLAEEDLHNEELTIRLIMSTTKGRRWVWRLLELANMFSAEASRLDPAYLAFKEGAKMMALFVLKPVQSLTPREYTLMVEENVRINQLIARSDRDDHDQGEYTYDHT